MLYCCHPHLPKLKRTDRCVSVLQKGRGGGRGGKRNRDDNRGGHQPYTRYPEVVKQNERLERYYNDLLQLPEEEREQFWAALKRELPNSFRFCGSKGYSHLGRLMSL